MKTCFKCERTLSLDEFYRHPMMADGHLGKCRNCTKKDVRENYRSKIERYRRYEKHRNQQSHRKAHQKASLRLYRARHPEKERAHRRVAYALRTGKLLRQPCEVCGEWAQAHHPDYSKPLDVKWLCGIHHRAEHK